MWKLRKSMKNRVIKKFLDVAGGEGIYTKVFDDLSQAAKEELIELFKVSEDEIPLLLSKKDDFYCVLLTNERLYWTQNSYVTNIFLNDIKDVTHGGLKQKMEMNQIRIITASDESNIIEVEPGKPFFGIWNTLLMIVRLKKE